MSRLTSLTDIKNSQKYDERIHKPQTWIISSTKKSLLIMCSYKLVFTITKHKIHNLKLDHYTISITTSQKTKQQQIT